MDEGVECANGHFVSDAALVQYVGTLSHVTAAKHDGFVPCQFKHRRGKRMRRDNDDDDDDEEDKMVACQ